MDISEFEDVLLNLSTADFDTIVEQVQNQPHLVMQVGLATAQAAAAYDSAKSKLAVVEHEVAQDMRANPEKYDLPKTTDQMIKTAVPAQKAYLDQDLQVRKAKKKWEQFKALRSALEDRRHALAHCVSLHAAGYAFAEVPKPTAKRKKRRSDA